MRINDSGLWIADSPEVLVGHDGELLGPEEQGLGLGDVASVGFPRQTVGPRPPALTRVNGEFLGKRSCVVAETAHGVSADTE